MLPHFVHKVRGRPDVVVQSVGQLEVRVLFVLIKVWNVNCGTAKHQEPSTLNSTQKGQDEVFKDAFVVTFLFAEVGELVLDLAEFH